MLLELLLASQLNAAPNKTEFELLRDKAAAQESELTQDQRNSLLILRAQLYTQALASCGLSNSKEQIGFDAVAEVRKHGRIKVVAQSGTSSKANCITKHLSRSKVPELPFLPGLLYFGITYSRSDP